MFEDSVEVALHAFEQEDGSVLEGIQIKEYEYQEFKEFFLFVGLAGLPINKTQLKVLKDLLNAMEEEEYNDL